MAKIHFSDDKNKYIIHFFEDKNIGNVVQAMLICYAK